MPKHIHLALRVLSSVAMLLGCSTSSDGGTGSPALGCTPGQEQPCACADGSQGSQFCNDDGNSLSTCSCDEDTTGGSPVATGGASTGGSSSGGALTGGASMGGSPGGGSPSGGAPSAGAGGAVVVGGTGPGGAGGALVGGAGGSPEPLPPPEGIPSDASCTGMALPASSDYGEMGPFSVVTIEGTGPDGNYTMFRPEMLGGTNGFLHPPVTWGNGIFTTPQNYLGLLTTIASNGFVIIASNSTNVNSALMTAGLDWLLAQNAAPGELQGMLATDCAVTIGYSLGGGAAVDSGDHPNVVTTVSFHGLQGAAEQLHAPLFLLTSTNDGFVTKAGYVQPTYDRSTVVPTLMATLEVPGAVPDNFGHLIPTNDGGEERAPAVAWLRYWVLGDQEARQWFFGNDCVLCQTPWVDIQRKNADWQ